MQDRHCVVMKIQILPIVAVLALYAQWRFASPFLPNPTLQHRSALVKHSPLILFSLAGLLMALALPNFTHIPFVIALFAGGAMVFAGLALAYIFRA